ncbi:toll/interleukin-1 receptor domain-containing protein [Pedobacter frigiditerrae]|uniref:toll/interleukin-1 receptor domain-containing protein n=1 Tax=Pedobacter frigiditerrae TaxID=2530452 RepID=UPI00292CD782|nr:toll/interleukin-1 receptor domain-containing protein [Pedobacter frigiditerrae]
MNDIVEDKLVKEETIFVTYCSDNKEHADKVERFVAKLRMEGYNATIDQILMQDHSSIDFRDMMHGQLQKADKVIVVLSSEYKAKTITEKGGVWIEYQLIRKLIDEEPKKYILVSFDGFGEELIPLAFKDRFVVDLRNADNWQKLYAKLNDEPMITLPAVGLRRPKIVAREIEPYEVEPTSVSNAVEDFLPTEGQAVVIEVPENKMPKITYVYNGSPIKPMFLTAASETLAATSSKLSWSISVRRFLDKAIEYDVDIPHTNVIFNIGAGGNKRSGFLDNLRAFSPAQQFEIMNEFCDEYHFEPKVPELKRKLVETYGKAAE